MHRTAILIGIDGDGARCELDSRTKRANGDLATIGDQDLAEHEFLSRAGRSASGVCNGAMVAKVRRLKITPYGTGAPSSGACPVLRGLNHSTIRVALNTPH